MNFIYDLHRTMISQKLILVYEGDFTQETTKSILPWRSATWIPPVKKRTSNESLQRYGGGPAKYR